MSKSTMDTKFRKVDVDQFAGDKFEEEENVDGTSTGPNENEIQTLLSQGNHNEALRCVLANAPILSRNLAVKEKALKLVMKTILSIKTSEIDATISSLDSNSCDILMKYIYKGFEIPSDGSSAALLTWHQRLSAVAGVGCIVRVLTDRKRV